VWPVASPSDIDPTKIFLEQLKLNKSKGFGFKLATAALSVPGASTLLKKGLEKDYKDNLY
jgi:hypothetical protein